MVHIIVYVPLGIADVSIVFFLSDRLLLYTNCPDKE